LTRSGEEEPGLREKLRTKNRRIEALRQRLQDAQQEIAGKDQEIETLRKQLARTASPSADGAPVFFLVGQAKSGTSWLMRMLDSHPEVLCRGEGRIFGRNYRREDIKRMQSRTLQPSSLYRAILDAEYLNAWVDRSVWTRDEDKDEHLDNLTRVATEYFLTGRLSKTGKRIVGDKTPFLSEEILAEISGIYPDARVIHIIRDGRDVAISTMHHLWNHQIGLGGYRDLEPEEQLRRDAYRENPQEFLEAGGELFTEQRMRDLAEIWNTQVGRAIKDGPELLGENYVEVRYEELLDRTEQEARRLFEFLGADADEQIVKQCVEAASFERWAKGRERGQEDSTALLRRGVTGDWKNIFTGRDKSIFKQEAGDLLIELGYEEGYDW